MPALHGVLLVKSFGNAWTPVLLPTRLPWGRDEGGVRLPQCSIPCSASTMVWGCGPARPAASGKRVPLVDGEMFAGAPVDRRRDGASGMDTGTRHYL